MQLYGNMCNANMLVYLAVCRFTYCGLLYMIYRNITYGCDFQYCAYSEVCKYLDSGTILFCMALLQHNGFEMKW